MQAPELNSIPTDPGIYIYKDKNKRILYVGKARNLRKRVLSYFRSENQLASKTVAMLSHARTIEYITTSTEKEALLLEASLIKKHRPHYNIELRDDKQYVHFRLDLKQDFPKLELVRRHKKDQAKYFGPYTSSTQARETLKYLLKTFPLRRCQETAFKNRIRPCLYHDLGQCFAPCCKLIDRDTYHKMLTKIVLFLSGKSKELIANLQEEMLKESEALNFENAAIIRDQLHAIEKTLEQQSVVLGRADNLDIVGILPLSKGLALGLLFVREGNLIDRRNFYLPDLSIEDAPELLRNFLVQFYTAQSQIAERIVLPWLPEDSDELGSLEELLSDLRQAPVHIGLARNLDERKLIDIAENNAQEDAKKRLDNDLSSQLAHIFDSLKPIRRIECVDVSHTGGTSTKVGMVVFEDGKAIKDSYRVYNVEDAHGDDYLALANFAKRRTLSDEPYPDLLLIDGGKGQLSVVQKAIFESKQELLTKNSQNDDELFLLAAITKARDEDGKADRRAGNISDRIFTPNRMNPLAIKAGSPVLLYLQLIRDTTHDFVIGRHRQARSKLALTGEVQRIEGIGAVYTKILWEHFNSLDAMQNATYDELKKLIGAKRARSLYERLNKHDKRDA